MPTVGGTIPGEVGLCCIREGTWASLRAASSVVSATAPASKVLPWALALASLHDGVKQTSKQPFPPQIAFGSSVHDINRKQTRT